MTPKEALEVVYARIPLSDLARMRAMAGDGMFATMRVACERLSQCSPWPRVRVEKRHWWFHFADLFSYMSPDAQMGYRPHEWGHAASYHPASGYGAEEQADRHAGGVGDSPASWRHFMGGRYGSKLQRLAAGPAGRTETTNMGIKATAKAIGKTPQAASLLGGLRKRTRCSRCGASMPCLLHRKKSQRATPPPAATPPAANDSAAAVVIAGQLCPTCGCYARLDNGDCVACSAGPRKVFSRCQGRCH